MRPVPNIDEVVSKLKEQNIAEAKATESTGTIEATKETANIEAENKTPQFNLDELTDEQISQIIEKRGLKVEKKEISAEDKLRQEQLEEVEKLQYAVATNQITPERYNELKTIINEDGVNLTKKEFKKLYKDEYKTAEELNDAYDDYYTVGKNVKVKQPKVQKNEDTGDDEIVEEEVEKPKFDEKLVKFGQHRIERATNRIKEGAKKELDSIDANFKNYKTLDVKAKQYTGEVEKLVASINPEKYSVSVKAGKEKVALSIDLGAEAKEKIKAHLINDLGGFFINGNLPAKEELQKIVDGYVKAEYEESIQDKYYEYVHGIGLRDARVGANAPLQKETFSSDKPDELAAIINKAIPKEYGGLINSIKK